MKYLMLLVLVFFICSCENEKIKEQKALVEKENIEKSPKDLLVDEFGEYKEEGIKQENQDYYDAYNKTLTLWNIPFHEVNIPTSQGSAHVIVSGLKNAEPLVLLHGMNASSTMWYPNIKALSQNYRVYAIDYLIEPGKSQMTGKITGIDDVVNWYYEIFNQLKLKKFSLIGASEGGWLSVKIALNETSRIKKMILLSPLQTFTWIPPSLKMSSTVVHSLIPKEKNKEEALDEMSIDVEKIDKLWIDQYFKASQKSNINLEMFQMIPYSDDELKTLTIPVLVLIGDNDIINKEKSIEKAKEILPHSETGIIKNAGHFLSIDQADTVNTVILDFLKVNHTSKIDTNIVN